VIRLSKSKLKRSFLLCIILSFCPTLLLLIPPPDKPEAPLLIGQPQIAPAKKAAPKIIELRPTELEPKPKTEKTATSEKVREGTSLPLPKAEKLIEELAAIKKTRILGFIQDRQGRGLPNSEVLFEGSMRRSSKHSKHAQPKNILLTTDENGHFEGEILPSNYRVHITAKGFAPKQIARILVRDTDYDMGYVSLEPGQELRGSVYNEQGRPLHLARVRVWRSHINKEALTDEEGRFLVSDLLEGLYQVSVFGRGFQRKTINKIPVVELRGGELTITLKASGQLQGLVRDVEGQVASNVNIAVYQGNKRLQQSKSKQDGTFHLKNLPLGVLEIYGATRRQDLVFRERIELRHEQDRSSHDFILQEPLSISGRLKNSRGELVPQRQITLKPLDTNPRHPLRTRSSEEGEFKFQGLHPGRYLLTAWVKRPGWSANAEQYLTLDHQHVIQDLVLPDTQFISGQVRNREGEPVPNIYVIANLNGQHMGYVRTNAAGNFKLTGLSSDNYDIFIRNPRDQKYIARNKVSILDGNLTNLVYVVDAPSKIIGRVLDPAGLPLHGIRVTAKGQGSLATVKRHGTTDQNGYFVIQPLYTGSYQLTAQSDSLILMARKKGFQSIHLPSISINIAQGKEKTLTWTAIWK
jgi:hypothetical protein